MKLESEHLLFEAEEIIKKLHEELMTDPLTETSNRRAFGALASMVEGKYTMAMVDADHFKQVNDNF